MSSWPAKDHEAVADYYVDWTPELDGDTIASSLFTFVDAQGVQINVKGQGKTQTASYVWLEQGTVGQIAILNCHITTDLGRQFDKTCILPILEQ